MQIKALALGGAAIAALTASCAAYAQPAQQPGVAAITAGAAPVSALVKDVTIPYQQFTLKNGLRVVVSTDRKAPIVAVSVWYNVGSKFEPAGKTGFAHLFEHLMFNGSENAPGDFFKPLKDVGATDFNGTTYFDRTNYFETVPRAALDRALFLESDRMGYLLGSVTQSVLDEQRGVVQNEKRQGDNQPYGLVQYKVVEGLFPAGHPYAHTTIGSMADLDAASLATVKDWFRGHYGPNNAVLVLAGDIDASTARPLVEKYFGGIPRGPESVVPPAPVPTLAAAKSEAMKDRVAATLLTRYWAVPGLNDKDSVALDVAAGVLGGLSSSRLDNTLIRQEKLATSVTAYNQSFAQVGQFAIRVMVKPGADPATVSRRLDEIVGDFLKSGPTADEVQRFATTSITQTVRGLESVGGFQGKAVTLAEGTLYSNDPGYYKKQLDRLAAETPASVKAAADKWLSRPVYALTVAPGPRDAYAEAVVPPKAAVVAAPDQPAKGNRGALPGVGSVAALTFPAVQRTRLANGIELIYAQRNAVPITQAVVSFDAGTAADVANKLGTQQLTLNMLDEGTTQLDSIGVAEAKERLGAQIYSYSSQDRTSVSLVMPSANLAPATRLLASLLRDTAFAPAEVERVKAQQLAAIDQELTNPDALASRVMPRLVFGSNYPYAKQFGAGDPKAVATLNRADLIAFQSTWLRPDKAKIFVVSDRPIGEVKAALDQGFGDWKAAGPGGAKAFNQAVQPSRPRIVLIDRPDSPQSVLQGGAPTGLVGTDDLLAVDTANDALGGSFLSRINMDLRESRHWSYGAGGWFDRSAYATPYMIGTSVQADQTGPSLASTREDIKAFLSTQPMTQEEFDRAIAGAVRSLSGNFETSDAVLNGMQQNDLFKRPDNYYSTVTQRYRALTLPQLNTAIQKSLDPNRFVWVVVGDAKMVKPQLDAIGLPVQVVSAASVASAGDIGVR